MPEAGELLLEFGGQSGRVNGGKVELRAWGGGEAVVDSVVGDVLVEIGGGPCLQETVVSVDVRERRDRGADLRCGGRVAGLERQDRAQVRV